MKYPIVASDLDGTLLNEKHSLSPFAKSVLTQLTSKGVHFIFATGRHYLDVLQRKDEMNIPAFMVTSNGATIHDTQGNLLLEQNIPEPLVYQLTNLVLDDPIIFTHVFQEKLWLTNRHDETVAPFLVDIDFGYHIADLLSIDTSRIHKVFFTVTEAKYRPHLERLKQYIEAHFEDLDPMFSSLLCLDVMSKGVNKGSAIKIITHRLKHSMKDVIAFGDSMNDYEMLSTVGKGFLMENANADLKQALPNAPMIGRNSEEAVPHYLHSLYQL